MNLISLVLSSLILPLATAASAQPSPAGAAGCDFRVVAVWSAPGGEYSPDFHTRLLPFVRDGSGPWKPLPIPEPRVVARSVGATKQTWFARTLQVESIRQSVGDRCTAETIRFANRSFGWAVAGEQGRLVPGLSIVLSNSPNGIEVLEGSGELGLFSSGIDVASLHTVEGDDLLITWKGRFGSSSWIYTLFAVSGETMIPFTEADPQRLQGSLRDVVVQVTNAGLTKITSALALVTETGELRIALEGSGKSGRKEFTFPTRPRAAEPTLKPGALFLGPGRSIKLRELDGWPVKWGRGGKLELSTGRHQLVAQLDERVDAQNQVPSPVPIMVRLAPRQARRWTPPLLLEFEVEPGAWYELKEVPGLDDQLGLAVHRLATRESLFKINRTCEGCSVVEVRVPWPQLSVTGIPIE